MAHDSSDGGRTEDESEGWRPTRRRTLQLAGAVGGVAGLGALASGQEDGPTRIPLVGRTAGWVYEGDLEAPFIAGGEQNPTLRLVPGREYEIVWENADGAPHNVVIRNEDGDQVVRSEIISEEGATQTVSFTATEEMATYLCEVHPNTMQGDIELVAEKTPTPTPEVGAGFFEDGAEVGVQRVAKGMTAPTDMAPAGGGDDRFFVTDQTGEVWTVTGEGRAEDPFIDVSDRMVELGTFYGDYADPQQEYDERGLLGIEFHPNFQENRRFYLHYSAPPDGVDRALPADNWDHWEVLSEFKASEDLSSGNPDSERRILEIPSPQYNHDSGPMAFGPDGYLYFPMGDGGGSGDNMYGHVNDWYDRNGGGNGQDITDNLMGSVLRIDVDAQGEDKPYGVPEDNPFVGTDALPEIYAYGFRNPYGISFDSDGNLYVADAGQALWEEANVVVKGGNYGWNVREGTHCFSTENPAEPNAITRCPVRTPDEPPHDGRPLRDPIVEYPHQYQGESVGITIVGGHRYEQSTISALQGKYVFGTWTTDPARAQPAGRVFTAEPPADFGSGGGSGDGETPTSTPTPTQTPTPTEDGQAISEEPEGVPRDELWTMRELVFAGAEDGTLNHFVRMFGRGADGEIYVLANQRGTPQGDTGVVLKLVPPEQGESLPESAAGQATPTETPTTTDGNATTTDGNATGQGDGNATGGGG